MLPFDNYPELQPTLEGSHVEPAVRTAEAAESASDRLRSLCGRRRRGAAEPQHLAPVSVDHVVPQQMVGVGYPADWVFDEANVVACCRPCNDLFNRDPVIGEMPLTTEAFFDLRDRIFSERRARIVERREAERLWFQANVLEQARTDRSA